MPGISSRRFVTRQDRVFQEANRNSSIEALAFSIMVQLAFTFEFVLTFEMFDPLFRKKKSINVIGTPCKPGTKNVKWLLIISGHHYSAPENTCDLERIFSDKR